MSLLSEERVEELLANEKEKDAEIQRIKALCARAAGVMEEEFGPPNDPAYGVKGPVHELIAELRKAAE
jgi:hypothetical protein